MVTKELTTRKEKYYQVFLNSSFKDSKVYYIKGDFDSILAAKIIAAKVLNNKVESINFEQLIKTIDSVKEIYFNSIV